MSRGSNCAIHTLFSSFLLLLIIVTTARAQDAATGAIRGTVLDPLGGRVPQATIVLVNTAIGVPHSAMRGAEGHFVFHILPPGGYSARPVAQGMSTQDPPPPHLGVAVSAE